MPLKDMEIEIAKHMLGMEFNLQQGNYISRLAYEMRPDSKGTQKISVASDGNMDAHKALYNSYQTGLPTIHLKHEN